MHIFMRVHNSTFSPPLVMLKHIVHDGSLTLLLVSVRLREEERLCFRLKAVTQTTGRSSANAARSENISYSASASWC